VGECAGVVIDLVQTLFYEAEEKLEAGAEAFANSQWGDSIYYTYAALINGAKALLLDKEIHVNTQHGVISDFDKYFVESGEVKLETSFKELVLQINENEPGEFFAQSYYQQAKVFLEILKQVRERNTLLK
jgi:sulfite reductase (ferredoxin)